MEELSKMEVKIFRKSLMVGVDVYKSLHNEIKKRTNMLDIRKLINKFEYDNKVDGVVYFQGIDVNESFCYVITNLKTNKEYIGETNNLISRMFSYITLRQMNNKGLINDMINLGLVNFSIKIIPSDNRKKLEKELIKSSLDCYNIVFSGKKMVLKQRKNYVIGGITFKTKKEIKAFIRENLDKLKVNTKIELDSMLGKFALDIIKYNKGYNNFDFSNKELILKVVLDNYKGTPGIGKWKVFCFEYGENIWGFSTNNCIDNM